jgi:hypothetical protein
MTTTPPEPVENPSSYAERGYDDRQADGMDDADGQAVASRDHADNGPGAPSDAERVEADPPAE